MLGIVSQWRHSEGLACSLFNRFRSRNRCRGEIELITLFCRAVNGHRNIGKRHGYWRLRLIDGDFDRFDNSITKCRAGYFVCEFFKQVHGFASDNVVHFLGQFPVVHRLSKFVARSRRSRVEIHREVDDEILSVQALGLKHTVVPGSTDTSKRDSILISHSDSFSADPVTGRRAMLPQPARHPGCPAPDAREHTRHLVPPSGRSRRAWHSLDLPAAQLHFRLALKGVPRTVYEMLPLKPVGRDLATHSSEPAGASYSHQISRSPNPDRARFVLYTPQPR